MRSSAMALTIRDAMPSRSFQMVRVPSLVLLIAQGTTHERLAGARLRLHQRGSVRNESVGLKNAHAGECQPLALVDPIRKPRRPGTCPALRLSFAPARL